MRIKIFLFILVILVLTIQLLFPQSRRIRELRKAYTAPEELVSLSGSMPLNQALLIFNDLSKKYLGKVIIDPEGRKQPIGVDVNNMHWLDALEKILRHNDLWYEDYPDYIKIVPMNKEREELTKAEKEAKAVFQNREVEFSAIFFETNYSKLREAGMSWDFFRGEGINLRGRLSAADTKTGLYEMEVEPDLDFGSLLALFKALESDKIGEVIASPQVTVQSGEEGRIQVGSDIAVTVQDFAGNAITKFFSTGSIIKVSPVVIRYDSIDFVNLDLQIERSNTATSAAGLEIKKSAAKTSVLLLDGEETIIGGLYLNEEQTSREGIPFLKDLPWWFFGLKYVFGYNSRNVVKNELLILIKADLLPTLAQRFRHKVKSQRFNNKLKEKKESIRRKIEFYKRQWSDD